LALFRAAACLSAALVLANCAATPEPEISRAAPATAAAAAPPDALRAGAGALACLAEAIYFEARGTGARGEAAVAHVVVNRARSAKFPRTVCGVVGDGCQFSYRCDGRPDALADPGARAHAFRTAEAVLSGAPDITGGALFFHSARAAPGGWFASRPRIGQFGGNVFYR
jgi:spore germination cell wall hydrolase CwlJ-like protein